MGLIVRAPGVGPNDTVQLDELSFEDDNTIEVEVEGVGRREGNDTVIKLVNIHSLDDFKKAADRAFARVPLQDEHSDWSPEIKKAIAERRLMQGMTKRQVFYVAGTPESARETEENGKKSGVWTMRQNRGVQIGFWTVSAGSPSAGLPKTLRFIDGKLEVFEASLERWISTTDTCSPSPGQAIGVRSIAAAVLPSL